MDGTIDGPIPLDGAFSMDGCPVAPTGDWMGWAQVSSEGTGSITFTRADVTFALASSTGCIDRYLPSGTTTYLFDGGQNCQIVYDPPHGTVAAADGELVIDRSHAPASFSVTGSTTWTASEHCSTQPPGGPGPVGGRWAAETGVFAGSVIDGAAVTPHTATPTTFEWHLRRVGATFPPPSGCVEAAHEAWTLTGDAWAHADVTWTRSSTDGCVDHFTPSGTVHAIPPASCADDPSGAPIASGDGTLTIDRSTNPPTYAVDGNTFWQLTRTCTQPDGTVTTWSGQGGGTWASSSGAYDGDVTGGDVVFPYDGEVAWRLER